ncbi:MAG: hypothetical protein IIB00_03180 [candidate division Zixibacteria bacterium]|nr:hypothetical protein [candidate division Zixibacteria bacterium]
MRLQRLIFFVSLSLALPASSFAGGTSGQTGIGFLVTDISTSLNLRIWSSENMTIEPTFSFSRIFPKNSGSLASYQMGLGIAAHWKPGEDLRPYIGGRISFDIASFNDETYADIAFSPVFGAEYFFSDHFSVGGEFQVIFVFTDDTFSPALLATNATYIQPAQALTVQLYF